jgi:amino acid adenylation domain-containing protein
LRDVPGEALRGYYTKALELLAAEPDASYARTSLLSDDERRTLAEVNDTHRAYPRDKCVPRLFEEQAGRTPQAVAVEACGESLTYEQLNERADRLAHHLRSMGVGPEATVALCAERSVEAVVGLLGILKAGGAYLPLDPATPAGRLRLMLADARPRVLLTTERLRGALPDAPPTVMLDADWPEVTRDDGANPDGLARPEHAAYVIYTSGSTGTPKGVVVEHASLTNYLSWVNRALAGGPQEVVPQLSGLGFDASLKQLLAPLLRGGRVWVVPDEVVSRPEKLMREFGSRPEVALNCVPSLWAALLDAFESGGATPPAAGLKRLLVGGEPLEPALLERTQRALPGLEVINLYGPTEATANATAARLVPGGTLNIGRPVDTARVYVLGEGMELLPPGVTGELYVGGVGVARGYLNRPALTAESFKPDPFAAEPGARLYRTGDVVRLLADGSLEFVGRADRQLKVRGFRVEPGEIEAALAEHPEVKEASVVPQEGERGHPLLAAYVVPRQAHRPSPDELRGFLKERLPAYMLPDVFMLLDALPRTTHGKVDRQALPPIREGRRSQAAEYAAPRNPLEELLAEIWASTLGLERVGIHDDFFQLGGHSLLAMRIVTAVRSTFRLSLSLRRVFEAPTVAQMAQVVEAGLIADIEGLTDDSVQRLMGHES